MDRLIVGVNPNAASLCVKARELARTGQYPEAERVLRLAISVDQECFEAYHWLEYALEAQEHFDEAVAVHEWGKWLKACKSVFER